MSRALLIIDIQRDYFPGGAFPLAEADHAADVARGLLDYFRSDGEPVFHMQHLWDDPEATYMRPGSLGVEIHDRVAPLAGENVVTKEHPNSFLDTNLEQLLRSAGVDKLVVGGMMSSTCVDATVRAASDLGFEVTVIHDACAAPNLEFNGIDVSEELVHAAYMAALAEDYATVISSDEFLSNQESGS